MDKKTTEIKKTFSSKSTKKTTKLSDTLPSDLELTAVITAAITSYTMNNFKIMSIKQKETDRGVHWRTQKSKIWRPLRKGVKKTW